MGLSPSGWTGNLGLKCKVNGFCQPVSSAPPQSMMVSGLYISPQAALIYPLVASDWFVQRVVDLRPQRQKTSGECALSCNSQTQVAKLFLGEKKTLQTSSIFYLAATFQQQGLLLKIIAELLLVILISSLPPHSPLAFRLSAMFEVNSSWAAKKLVVNDPFYLFLV